MKTPYWLLKMLPMWDYACPRCKKEVSKNSHKCPHCGERYPFPLRVPPSCLKSKEALEKYVHEKIFPKLSSWQREYLAQYFTVIFQDGFESGDFSGWTGTFNEAPSPAPTVVTTPVHHGSYAAKLATAANWHPVWVYKTFATTYQTLYFRVYFQADHLPDNSGDWLEILNAIGLYDRMVRWYNDAGTVKWQLAVKDDGSEWHYALSTTSPLINTWCCVELYVYSASPNGEVRLYVDGVEVASLTGLNIGYKAVDRVEIRSTVYAGGATTNYFDCVVVSDTGPVGPELGPPPPTYKLTISTSEGGTTNPTPGTYTVTQGSTVQVTAIPYGGYQFDHWELDGVNVGSSNPITLVMDMDHSLLAVFTQAPTPPFFEVINPCTELSYIYQGKEATWMNNGKAPYAEAVIVSDGDLLPDGKTVKSYLSGKCTRLMTGFVNAERQCCNFYAAWICPSLWDLTGKELVKVRLLTNNPNLSFELYSFAGEPFEEIGSVRLSPGQYPTDSWFEMALDLRVGGLDKLKRVLFICVYVSGIGDQNTTYALTEYWTVEPAAGPVPLGCSISPTSAVIDVGQIIGITAKAWGGTPPYTVEWIVNNEVVRTDTISIDGGTTTYNFSSDTAGTYEVYVNVTDSGSPPQSIESSKSIIIVKAPAPPREPCRPLHVEGNIIKDDLGRTVHLHGVGWHGFEDHPYGHMIDITGSVRYNTWDETILRDMLDGLVSWGVNCVRFHCSAAAFKGNYGNIQNHFKTILTECMQRGIYVILEFYDVGYYGMGAEADPLPWRPVNADFGPVYDVTGYSSVRWNRLGDVFPDISAFVEFWRSIANMFKTYPNFIIEFWNEPHVPEGLTESEAMNEWFNVVQQCINAVREVGAKQLIIVQWGYGVAYYPWDKYTYSAVPWYNDYASKLTDPQNNIVISTHAYRNYDGFGRWEDGTRGYTIDQITEAFAYEFLPIAEKQPLIIGELGAYVGDGLDATALRNAYTVLNQRGIHYIAWWWFPGGPNALLSGGPNYEPTEKGIALIQAISELAPPTPPITATLSGFVRDVNGNPIAGAVVTCDGYADVTEVDGSYIIADIPAKSYTLTVTKEGYQTKTIPVDLSAGGTFTLDITLSPAPKPPPKPKVVGPLGLWNFPILTWIIEFIRRIRGK